MRIAVIEPFPYGGLLHYSTQLADALAERGNDVELVVPANNELADWKGAAHRLPILPTASATAAQQRGRAARTARRIRTALRLATSWHRIHKYVRSYRGDAIVLGGCFDLTPTMLAGLRVAAVKNRAALAHICHNVRIYDRWHQGELYLESKRASLLLGALYPRFDLILVHGERSRLEFEATWPYRALQTIPHGNESVFAAEPPPEAPEPRVLFYGTWSKVKGLPMLMEAFDELLRRMPEGRLTIAGSPAFEEGQAERVIAWAAQRNEVVEVIPRYISIEETKELFARARVVALPYYTAYQSGVAHLAMTMARAAVATDVGDLPEAIIDGETGFIVPPNDPLAFASALERLLREEALAARMGQAAFSRARTQTSWSKVAEILEAHLARLIDSGSR
jgi:glycosyltransferase involved in cell wall biosynthesis